MKFIASFLALLLVCSLHATKNGALPLRTESSQHLRDLEDESIPWVHQPSFVTKVDAPMKSNELLEMTDTLIPKDDGILVVTLENASDQTPRRRLRQIRRNLQADSSTLVSITRLRFEYMLRKLPPGWALLVVIVCFLASLVCLCCCCTIPCFMCYELYTMPPPKKKTKKTKVAPVFADDNKVENGTHAERR